ncbi:MAG: anti-sigma factor antagonist [Oscillospiraceae bacterium]|nr:anti-sigma factor antagonist [Oscillospiraceae bacterium]
MTVRIQTGERMTVYLAGEIDHHAAGGARMEIDLAIERTHPVHVTLDFSGVTFMDSSGIGLILGRHRLMQGLHGTLSVTGAAPGLRKVMKLAGLDKLGILENVENQKSAASVFLTF